MQQLASTKKARTQADPFFLNHGTQWQLKNGCTCSSSLEHSPCGREKHGNRHVDAIVASALVFFWGVTFLNLLTSKLFHRTYRSCTRQRLRRSVASVFIVFAPNSMYVRSMNTNQINHICWPSKTNHTVAMHDVDTVTYMLKGSECSMLYVWCHRL